MLELQLKPSETRAAVKAEGRVPAQKSIDRVTSTSFRFVPFPGSIAIYFRSDLHVYIYNIYIYICIYFTSFDISGAFTSCEYF